MRREEGIGLHRWLLEVARPLTGFIAVYILFSVGWHVFSAVIPVVTGKTLDAVLEQPGVLGDFRSWVLILLSAVVARGLCGLGSTYFLESVANGLVRDVRSNLFQSLLRKNQTFFNRRSSGDLTSRATGDADRINLMISPGLDMAVDVLLSLIVPLIFIAFIDVRLLLWPVIFLFGFVISLLEHGRRLTPVAAMVREANGNLSATASEVIGAMEFMAASGGAGVMADRFADQVGDYRKLAVRQVRTNAVYLPPLALIVAATGGVLHALSLATSGQITSGQVVAYVGLLSALRGPINIGGTSIGFIVQGLSAAGRVHEVVADRTGDDEREGGHSSSIAGDMTFDGVTFGYGDMTVFDDASFEIEAGQFVAIVGATGSGKTTLVQLLNGTYFADNGRVLVDGCSVEEWDLESLRSQIAVIEQDVTLFSRSIRDNVTFGLADGVDDGTVRWALELAQADEFVDRMTEGMNTVVGERGVTLSGGQRQRIGIARALLVDPRILVLDDATSALDAATERRMRDAIFGAAKGRTTLLISNRLACIREADRILVLDKGRVAGFGTHRELMATVPLYARMYEPYQVADVAVSAAGGGR